MAHARNAAKGLGPILARQVLDAKAAGSTKTRGALAVEAGVNPGTVYHLNANDKSLAAAPSRYNINLRLCDNAPALPCMQEGPVWDETPFDRNNRNNRNFTRRRAVLRAAAVAAAAEAAEVKDMCRLLSLAPTYYYSASYYYC